MIRTTESLVFTNTIERKTYKEKFNSPTQISDKVYFSGLSRCLKKGLFDDSELQELLKKYPKSNGYIGSMPKEWIDKIPQKARKETIKSFYSELGDIALKMRKIKSKKKENTEISEAITNLFYKTGLIDKNQQLKIRLIGSGGFGDGYLIENLDNYEKKYVLKVFKNKTTFFTHGALAEANRGLFWRKNAGKNTQYTDLYFADAKNGYLVTRYIKDNEPEPKRFIDPVLLGIKIIDKGNIIAKFIIDFGGISSSSSILSHNTKARNIHKLIGKTPENNRTYIWKNKFDNKAQSQYNDVILGLLEAMKFIPDENKAECLIKFANTTDNELKIRALRYLGDIPRDKQKDFFTEFSKKADNILAKELLKKLIYLPKDERKEIKTDLINKISTENSLYRKFLNIWYY